MAARRSERLVNLAIALLSARRFLSKAELRRVVEAYRGLSDSAFERQFERDKDDLRAMGVPVVMGSNDVLFDDDTGYRISRSDFELPPVSFDSDELSALGAASRVWQQASAAEQTISALAKLRAAGADPDVERLAALAPRISAREPAFEVCWRATLERQLVRFGYRGSPEVRTVAPWSVLWRRGSWYLLGLDLTREGPRMFKMSRMNATPETVGGTDAYQVPDDVDLQALARQVEPGEPDSRALLALRDNKAPALRRIGTPVAPPRALPEGFACFEVPYTRDSDFVADIAAAGPDVVVLEPAELRDQVLAQLRAVLEVSHDRS
ncbi:helix-turn-helix transcriptional regulator [Propionibacterium freudenreichii]|uniref:Protein pafB n=2 Tax=Propionibacterium freudenreichii TaxID=1744 RepID=A0A2C7Z5F7_9ACTN|nr:WYL domain-containing protein [Propionibacterium freudenreichii]CEP27681.1 DeoR-family transcriptional regulator [Propionibacterium freudenreichii subsp. freudenreichii]MCT2977989.1 WYL domain-containing protein [Propionibacterium freudenreichii]MCT2985051.1 WYL domain-containing protein [Propionibacterium freudenreichii]MCT2986409.1 WYL domain-containing protein [Propionibacterium freudenreichii]MCT3016078.1 WYL domain-containing protein [Propionibacterium freudenreichii]